MKRLSTLILSLCTILPLAAQGYLSLPLGSDSNKVLSLLAEKKAEVSRLAGGVILARSGAITATYRFHNGRLYEMETAKSFDDKKQTSEAFKQFVQYFESIQTPFSETQNEGETQLYAMNEREINIVQKKAENGVFTLEHRAISLIWQPGTGFASNGSMAMLK